MSEMPRKHLAQSALQVVMFDEPKQPLTCNVSSQSKLNLNTLLLYEFLLRSFSMLSHAQETFSHKYLSDIELCN